MASTDPARIDHWNYRLARHTEDGEDVYDIREVYYNANGVELLWTDVPAAPHGVSNVELAGDLEEMLEATTRPRFDLDAAEAKRVGCEANPLSVI